MRKAVLSLMISSLALLGWIPASVASQSTEQEILKRNIELKAKETTLRLCYFVAHPSTNRGLPGAREYYFARDPQYRASVIEWWKVLGGGLWNSVWKGESAGWVSSLSVQYLKNSEGYNEAKEECSRNRENAVEIQQALDYGLSFADGTGHVVGYSTLFLGYGAAFRWLSIGVRAAMASRAGRFFPALLKTSRAAQVASTAINWGLPASILAPMILQKKRDFENSRQLRKELEGQRLVFEGVSEHIQVSYMDLWSGRILAYEKLLSDIKTWEEIPEGSSYDDQRRSSLEPILYRLEKYMVDLPSAKHLIEELSKLRNPQVQDLVVLEYVQATVNEFELHFVSLQKDLDRLQSESQRLTLNEQKQNRLIMIRTILRLIELNQIQQQRLLTPKEENEREILVVRHELISKARMGQLNQEEQALLMQVKLL